MRVLIHPSVYRKNYNNIYLPGIPHKSCCAGLPKGIHFCKCKFTLYASRNSLNSQRRPSQLPLRISNHSHVRRVSRRNTKGNLRAPLANANMRESLLTSSCLLAKIYFCFNTFRFSRELFYNVMYKYTYNNRLFHTLDAVLFVSTLFLTWSVNL